MKSLIRWLTSTLAGALLAAVAALVGTLGAAFVIYALAVALLPTATAAALTALVFAIVAAALAFAIPQALGSGGPHRASAKAPVDTRLMRSALEMGTAVAGVLSDMSADRRLKKDQHKRDAKRKRRDRR